MSHSVVPPFPRALRHRILSALVAASAIAAAPGSPLQPQTASIEIDAGTQEGRISPLLYGQFAEFMFEGIKGGLHAELIRNRSFEESPNAIGISRYWERYPDDRNDDYAISFHWDAGGGLSDAAPVGRADRRALAACPAPSRRDRRGMASTRRAYPSRQASTIADTCGSGRTRSRATCEWRSKQM